LAARSITGGLSEAVSEAENSCVTVPACDGGIGRAELEPGMKSVIIEAFNTRLRFPA
jgi:hypothetical protein